MKFLILLFVFLFSHSAYPQNVDFTCLNEDKFQQVLEIDLVKRIITHKTSFDFETGKKYDVFKSYNVNINTENIISYVVKYDTHHNYTVIDLEEIKLLSSAIYFDEYDNIGLDKMRFYNQIYDCFISN